MVIFTCTRHVLLNKPCTTLYSSKPTEVIEADILATHRAGHFRNQLLKLHAGIMVLVISGTVRNFLILLILCNE